MPRLPVIMPIQYIAQVIKKTAKWLFLLFFLMIGLLYLYLGWLYIDDRFINLHDRLSCVETPNGLLMGGLSPYKLLNRSTQFYAIRTQTGELISHSPAILQFWSLDGFAGRFTSRNVNETGHFVYVNEIGLIYRHSEPEKYAEYFERIYPEQPVNGIVLDSDLFHYEQIFSGQLKQGDPTNEYMTRGNGRWHNFHRRCPFLAW